MLWAAVAVAVALKLHLRVQQRRDQAAVAVAIRTRLSRVQVHLRPLQWAAAVRALRETITVAPEVTVLLERFALLTAAPAELVAVHQRETGLLAGLLEQILLARLERLRLAVETADKAYQTDLQGLQLAGSVALAFLEALGTVLLDQTLAELH